MHSPWVKRAIDGKLSPASYDSFRPVEHGDDEHDDRSCYICTPLVTPPLDRDSRYEDDYAWLDAEIDEQARWLDNRESA